jgi:hypoxanthine phosphoribosyltransferase
MSEPVLQLVFSAAEIDARVRELAARIRQDCGEHQIVLLVVLKGAAIFAADLMRHLSGDVFVDFFVVSNYVADGQSSGEIQLHYRPRTDLTNRHVILIDEIVDTGVTIDALLKQHLAGSGASSIRVCTLLDKVAARRVPVVIDYVGFEAPNLWLVGYGMDTDGLGRNLPDIHAMPNPSSSG